MLQSLYQRLELWTSIYKKRVIIGELLYIQSHSNKITYNTYYY